VVGFCYLIDGFTNGQLVEGVCALLSLPYISRQATYDLRRLAETSRLKRKGMIHKIQGTHR